jgi:hypothetical protein
MAIMSAVIKVQKQQSTSPITITFNTGSHQTKSDEHLLIVQDYEIPPGRQGETFHELIDYVILLVPADSYCMSQFLREATPNVRWRSIDQVKSHTNGGCSLAIVEAKSPIDWEVERTSCNPVYCDAEKHVCP